MNCSKASPGCWRQNSKARAKNHCETSESEGSVPVACATIAWVWSWPSHQSAEVPAYGVLTRWGSDDVMTERMNGMVHLFEDNGAMFMRYWTIMTGIAAGRRLLAVAYPSMDAIEKTYNALRGSSDYQSMLGDIDLDFRNIVRIAG